MKVLILLTLFSSCSTVKYDTYMRNCVLSETYHTNRTSEEAKSYCHHRYIKDTRMDKPTRDK